MNIQSSSLGFLMSFFLNNIFQIKYQFFSHRLLFTVFYFYMKNKTESLLHSIIFFKHLKTNLRALAAKS